MIPVTFFLTEVENTHESPFFLCLFACCYKSPFWMECHYFHSNAADILIPSLSSMHGGHMTGRKI